MDNLYIVEMNPHEPLKELDAVLSILSENFIEMKYSQQIIEAIRLDVLSKYQLDIDIPTLILIIEKLKEDGYVWQTGVNIGIKYNGLLFIQKGGYKNQVRTKANKQKRIRLEGTLLTIGSLLAGLYGLVQICIWIHGFLHSCH